MHNRRSAEVEDVVIVAWVRWSKSVVVFHLLNSISKSCQAAVVSSVLVGTCRWV